MSYQCAFIMYYSVTVRIIVIDYHFQINGDACVLAYDHDVYLEPTVNVTGIFLDWMFTQNAESWVGSTHRTKEITHTRQFVILCVV